MTMQVSAEPCKWCGEKTVIVHVAIGDGVCESCGRWQAEADPNYDYEGDEPK